MPDQPTYACPASDECPGDPEGVEAAYQRGLIEGRAQATPCPLCGGPNKPHEHWGDIVAREEAKSRD